MRKRLPSQADFPADTDFYIKEFDVPLAWLPDGSWVNWFGGRPRPYDPRGLKPGNNWPAESFEQWLDVVRGSL